jgi:hypothetical protein
MELWTRLCSNLTGARRNGFKSGACLWLLSRSRAVCIRLLNGVLYFSIPSDRKEMAGKEWVELKRLAGSGQILGFTEYWLANPSDPQGNPHTSLVVHVHKNGPLGLPDAYPLGIGVLRIDGGHTPGDYERQIITQLKESRTQP